MAVCGHESVTMLKVWQTRRKGKGWQGSQGRKQKFQINRQELDFYFLHKLHGLGKITLRRGCNTPYIARPDKFELNTSSIQELMLCFNTVVYIIHHIQEPMLCFNTSLYYSSYLGANAMFQYKFRPNAMFQYNFFISSIIQRSQCYVSIKVYIINHIQGLMLCFNKIQLYYP